MFILFSGQQDVGAGVNNDCNSGTIKYVNPTCSGRRNVILTDGTYITASHRMRTIATASHTDTEWDTIKSYHLEATWDKYIPSSEQSSAAHHLPNHDRSLFCRLCSTCPEPNLMRMFTEELLPLFVADAWELSTTKLDAIDRKYSNRAISPEE